MQECCENCKWAEDIGDDLYLCPIDGRTKDPEMYCEAYTESLMCEIEKAREDSKDSQMLYCE